MKENNYPADSYKSATGPIRYNFMNDAMFKISFQKQDILIQFLSALLRLAPEEIRDIKVNNTFIPGGTVDRKTFVLDIDLTLNGNQQINIELQIVDQGNWIDRSLHYLCRNFDHLYPGEDYKNTKGTLHISILDFTLFPDHPEFYAFYRMMHTQKHYIYNDKFRLNVLNLTQIGLATEEDKAWRLDRWAALFKASTWEEMKAMAENNSTFEELAQDLYEYNSDDMIRRICQKREDNARQERWVQHQLKEAEARAMEAEAKANTLEADNLALRARIAELEDKRNP